MKFVNKPIENLWKLIKELNLQKLKKKKFIAFEVTDKNFGNETISNLNLPMTSFKNLRFDKMEFKKMDLELSSFENCSFKNCSFKNCYLGQLNCRNCEFKNCQFLKSTFKDANFNKVIFTNCNFLKNSLVDVWFRSCKFINISIETNDRFDLVQTVIANSTFGKLDKSITFNGEFFLIDILLPSNKLDDLLS